LLYFPALLASVLLLNCAETALPTTRDQLLERLKLHGPAQAEALADGLAVSAQAVRQLLAKLLAAGLVRYEDRSGEPGRPKRFWSLTSDGNARFPDRHAELTVSLIAAIRAEFGEAGLDRLIARRETAAAANYRAALAAPDTLAAKVAALAALRDGEGYMARWHETAPGFVLVEDHCPICAAASTCQGFCRSELTLFQIALGPDCTVERTEHLLGGARRCAYRITPRESPVS